MFGLKKSVTYTFEVRKMSCSHCSARVEKALLAIKGVKSAKVDLETKTATVTANESVTLDSLKNAVKDIGFDA